MQAVLLTIAGLLALIGGAEILVRCGARLAGRLGVSPMVIGLTIVAIGTSTPELAVGIDAALNGQPALVASNIAGTNSFNLLFILGLGALMAPIRIDGATLRIDAPVMLVSAIALIVVAADGMLSRIEGLVLVAGGIAYTILVVMTARSRTPEGTHMPAGPGERPVGRTLLDLAGLVAGIACIALGADWLVAGASTLATLLGASETVIGLTIVAIGTSSPELVTLAVSTLRGERQMAVGNLIGSSSYNILIILGLTMVVPGQGIPVEPLIVLRDIPVMAGAVVACLVVFFTRREMSRIEGGLFVLAYIAYFGWLVATRS